MRINKLDNVEVNIKTGHKYALQDILKGENVIKYGFPIGYATEDIKKGDWVHSHNLKTGLGEILTYEYTPSAPFSLPNMSERTFEGYLRENGNAGIRNEIWIINTVGCVNKIAEKLANMTGAHHFPHPFGCSQLGDDHLLTQQILKGMTNHPNAAGVLVLGLGCENNHIGEFKKVLGEYNPDRVKFLNTQDVADEIAEGVKLIEQLKTYRDSFPKQKLPVSMLKVGLKCGGSDGYSGITANPLVGRFSDLLIAHGGTSVLTEVPEMFGAETLLMNRCINEEVFKKYVDMINGFKEYFIRHDQVIYENPSPGNKEGGITTLEEKSLGCVQKSGFTQVVDVLDYGDTLTKSGLNVLNGPGNDIVAITNLMAAGAQMILFTTGRGTPIGSSVPTVKISTNNYLAENKKHWIDFNAGGILEGKTIEELGDALFEYVIDVASGEETKNEQWGYREISIFKDGVTL